MSTEPDLAVENDDGTTTRFVDASEVNVVVEHIEEEFDDLIEDEFDDLDEIEEEKPEPRTKARIGWAVDKNTPFPIDPIHGDTFVDIDKHAHRFVIDEWKPAPEVDDVAAKMVAKIHTNIVEKYAGKDIDDETMASLKLATGLSEDNIRLAIEKGYIGGFKQPAMPNEPETASETPSETEDA